MPNLIGRSTSYELVTEVRLVLRGGIVLVDPVTTDSTAHVAKDKHTLL